MDSRNKKLRVLSYKPGASNEYAFALNNKLVEMGIEVLMVCDTKFDMDKYFTPFFGIRKIFFFHKRNEYFFSKGIKYFYSIVLFCLILLKFRPHIIHIQWFKFLPFEYYVFNLLKSMGFKIVFTSHDVLPADYTERELKFYNKVYHISDVIIVHSNSTKTEITRMFKINPERITTIKHSNFEFIAEKYLCEKNQARRLLGIDTSAKVILFFGAIREYKGFDILLDAFKRLKEEGNVHNLQMIVAGGGGNKFYFISDEDMRYLQATKDILYDDSFCDLDKMVQYFCASDVCVMPYRRISASGILILAFACGKPVIVSDIGGFPEYVHDNETGYLVPLDDKKELLNAMMKIFENENQIRVMSEKCKEYSRNELSWEICAEKTISIYKGLLKKQN